MDVVTQLIVLRCAIIFCFFETVTTNKVTLTAEVWPKNENMTKAYYLKSVIVGLSDITPNPIHYCATSFVRLLINYTYHICIYFHQTGADKMICTYVHIYTRRWLFLIDFCEIALLQKLLKRICEAYTGTISYSRGPTRASKFLIILYETERDQVKG